MGRAFEARKHKKMKRWGAMAKAFVRVGRQLSVAVKQGGPDPETNPKLRLAIQNAKGVNMPKDRIEAAIKKASSKDEKDLTDMVYEGYGPYGVAIVVEAATDNGNRTVANVRMHFNKMDGELGKTGSLDFLFNRKGVFTIKAADMGSDLEEAELELIDFGLESIEGYHDEEKEEDFMTIYTDYKDFGAMVSGLEEKGIEVVNAELQRIPTVMKEGLSEEQEEKILTLVDRLEDDEDVLNVFHNMA